VIPWFQFEVWHLGPISIHAWGFFVALGMLLSLRILWRRDAALVDHALWMIIAGLIGSRLFHVFLYEPGFYFSHPLAIFKVWQGGLSSFGGLAGAIAGFFLFRKHQKKSLITSDLMSYAAVFGWLVGRLGCVMIHDHPGRPCNCFLDIQTPYGPKLDMALLEILLMLPLAAWFYFTRKQARPAGWHTGVLFMYYGALRFLLDFLRTGDTRYFGLTPAQFFGILLVLVGAYLLNPRRISA
jgi:phosphatidylglycerol:prolipoprotein diacylglycerol transferase